MSLLRFNINGQVITSEEQLGPIVADTIGYLKAYFSFQSPEWQDLTLYALFKDAKGVTKKKVLLEGGMCDVPHEVIKPKYMKVSVYGLLPNGVLRITTNDSIIFISQSGFADDAVTPEQPTPDIYQQINDKMAKQAIDATRAETAQEEAEQAERIAKSHTEQTGEDRIATGEDRVATGADRSAVNTALLGFAETTLPAAIESVENKADSEITRVGQAGDAQVQAVETEGAEQKTSIVSYCEEQQSIIDQKVTSVYNAKNDAVAAKNKAEIASNQAATHDILTQTEFTDEQKATARQNIDAAKMSGSYELIETITVAEDMWGTFRTQEPDGTPYAFTAVGVVISSAVAPVSSGINLICKYNTTRLNASFINAIFSTTIPRYGYAEVYQRNGMWDCIGCLAVDDFGWTANTITGSSPKYIFSSLVKDNPYITGLELGVNVAGAVMSAGTVINVYGVRV